MREPSLSVVIPAYNAAATLDEQLHALAEQQTTFAWEVLVCDNGSTDRTADLVRQWQDRLPNLRLVDASARRGPAAARNGGVSAAAAPLIAFCDADDVVGTGWLQAMHDALQRASFVTGSLDSARLNASNRASPSWAFDGVYTKTYLPWLKATGAGNMGVRKAAFQAVRGFDETLRTNEDTDLAWRLQLAGFPLLHDPRIRLHLRQRDGLRAVFRQAYAYGAGDRQLLHRYALVIQAYRRELQLPPRREQHPEAREQPRRLTSVLRRIISVRSPADFADPVWRAGQWLGRRTTVNRAMEQVEPPSTLPVSDPEQS